MAEEPEHDGSAPDGESAPDGDRRRPVTLLVPAYWLVAQAVILVVGLAVFTLRPGVVAERFTGMLAGIAIAAVLLTAARGLFRATPLGHVVAVALFALESAAFGLSLIQGRGGAWQVLQLTIALGMLVLLFLPLSRDAITRAVSSETDDGLPTYME